MKASDSLSHKGLQAVERVLDWPENKRTSGGRNAMNFELTPDQVELRDAARKLATEVFRDKAAGIAMKNIPRKTKNFCASLVTLG